MSLYFADLVREASHGTGAGDLPLAGAIAGHRRFADAVPPGARFHYCIAGVTHPHEWETGEGEIGSGDSLIRLPLASSAGGAAVDFSPGLKTVALTVGSAWFADQESGQQEPVGIADVEGLQAALDGKAAADHGHPGEWQPADAELGALAALDSAADRVPYFTGPGTAALAVFTPFGRALVDDADAAAARATLGLGGMAEQSPGAVSISGGTVSGLSSLSAGSLVAAATGTAQVSFAASGSGETKLGLFALDVAGNMVYRNSTAGAHFYDSFTGSFHWRSTGGGTHMTLAPGSLNLASGGYSIAGTQVLGGRRTGWTVPSGTANRTAFDTATATTTQLAERLKALLDDLAAHGLIGN